MTLAHLHSHVNSPHDPIRGPITPKTKQAKKSREPPTPRLKARPEVLRYEAEKLADNELGDKAASWQTQYQREKSEVSEGTDSCRGSNEGEPSGVAADTQEEPKLDAADAQGEPMLDLNQSEKNEATADAHMVGSRRSTLLYGDSDEQEMIEGRPVYERTKVPALPFQLWVLRPAPHIQF